MHLIRPGLVSLLTCVLLAGGCSDGKPRRYEISGSVRFQGQPLDQGSIQFNPQLSGGYSHAGATDSPKLSPSGAPIRKGRFVVPKSHGLAPGTYTVVISSGERGTDIRKEMDPEQAGGEPYPIARERIPAEYNAKSTLKIEVKDGGPFTFDFDLKAK